MDFSWVYRCPVWCSKAVIEIIFLLAGWGFYKQGSPLSLSFFLFGNIYKDNKIISSWSFENFLCI